VTTRLRAFAPIALAALAVCGCGGAGRRSTLPPAPGRSGAVALRDLARYPEVYAGAEIATSGSVAGPAAHRPRYTLRGGHGARIALEPAARVRAFAGRRVRLRGTFSASFASGYEIVVSGIRGR
jgi:hypothetical protein